MGMNVVKCIGPFVDKNTGITYQRGQVFEIESDKADRWIKQGVVGLVERGSPSAKAAATGKRGKAKVETKEGPADESTSEDAPDLHAMKKDQLIELASAYGIDTEQKTKGDLITAIEAA